MSARVLFVCLHNAGRSQMSAALFERAVEGRHQATSAGTAPAERVHPEVLEAMREVGVDLSDRRPRKLTRELAEEADVVVTMGCGDECPYIPGKRYVDWDLPDPSSRPLAQVRDIRDEIARRVGELADELDRTSTERERPTLEAFEHAYSMANEAFNRHDFESAFRGFDPELEWETVASVPGPAHLRGRRAVIEGFRELVSELPDWRVEPLEFLEVGDAILVRNLGTATGGQSGVPVRQPFTQVWSFRDGLPIRVREFLDHADALEAVR